MSEETKDCTRLPVVAWQVEFPLGNGAKVYEQRPSWAHESYGDIAYVTHELCRLTDAQARLAEKNARIAQLAAHARGKNKALANALKEIERWKSLAEASNSISEICLSSRERAERLGLQSAPAERGAPDETAMARALCNYHADLCGVNCDDQWNLYSEDVLNDVAVMLAADRRLNPAPATTEQPWIPVGERLPESGRTVLAYYPNSHGKVRRIRAEYIAAKTKGADDGWESDCDADYDEATDQSYWPCGWYEVMDNWDVLTHVAVTEGDVTHWMPLPAAPATADSDVREVSE